MFISLSYRTVHGHASVVFVFTFTFNYIRRACARTQAALRCPMTGATSNRPLAFASRAPGAGAGGQQSSILLLALPLASLPFMLVGRIAFITVN